MKVFVDFFESLRSRIGDLTDYPVLVANQTLLGYAKGGYQHVHEPARCYPTLADPKTFTSGAAKWVEGTLAEFIPANTITTPFDIHYLNVEAASDNTTYEISLWSGLAGAEVEIGRVRTVKQSVAAGFNGVPIQIPPQPANTRISVKLATPEAKACTITFSVFYHRYTIT